MTVIVSLISISVYSSVMYRNIINLWVFILYHVTFLNSFVSSRSFPIKFFGTSKSRIMSLANRGNFQFVFL